MANITVIGGINIDIEGSPFKPLVKEDSNPGRIEMSFGGVGRNIVENVARAGGSAAMISVVGEDHMGQGAVRHLEALGVDVRGDCRTQLKALEQNRDIRLRNYQTLGLCAGAALAI